MMAFGRITCGLVFAIAVALGWGALVFAMTPADQTPYKKMLEDPLEFSGYDGGRGLGSGQTEIPLGLYAPNPASGRPGRCLLQGAMLAVEEINAQTGPNNHHVILVRRWAENPWNAGSREMLRLAYQDRVMAVIGFLSDASHIAEQIATKAYLPIVTPISSDPSLTHARVPWIFRLPPDDAVQARVLVDQGLLAHGYRRPGLITGLDQDSRMAETRLLSALKYRRTPPLFHFKLPGALVDYRDIINRIQSFCPDSLILRMPPDGLTALVNQLAQAGLDYPLLMPWIPGWDQEKPAGPRINPLLVVEPFDRSESNRPFHVFAKAYLARFGESPSFSSAYAYDAAHILAQTLQTEGLGRKGLRDALAASKERLGVTGPIHWDTGGGNLARPVIRFYPAILKRTSRKSESPPMP